jgi:hypothetical protein
MTPQECFEWIERNTVDIISYPKPLGIGSGGDGKTCHRWMVRVWPGGENPPSHFYANSLDVAVGWAMEKFP